MASEPRGKFFEDFTVGQTFETPRRTITSTDIVNFACLSGDFNGVHADHEYCKTTPFGEPIAHAPLVYAVMGGLQYASGVNDGTLIAVLGVDQWRMHGPVKHADTLFMRSTVLEKKETSRPDRGVVTLKREFVNQRAEVVQSMIATFMYKRRAPAGKDVG